MQNLKKCELYYQKVTFLGHNEDLYGLRINCDKVSSVQAWPKSMYQRSTKFLGFVQSFRQLIWGFSKIALPLTNLTKQSIKF